MFRQLRQALRRRNAPREIINAVHDDDLVTFLTSIGAVHDLEQGKLRCKFCRDTVTLDTVQAVFPDSGGISYICNKPSCIHDFMAYEQEVG